MINRVTNEFNHSAVIYDASSGNCTWYWDMVLAYPFLLLLWRCSCFKRVLIHLSIICITWYINWLSGHPIILQLDFFTIFLMNSKFFCYLHWPCFLLWLKSYWPLSSHTGYAMLIFKSVDLFIFWRTIFN